MPTCPNCHTPLADAPDLAGQFVACPKCGKQFPMPPSAAPLIDVGPRIPPATRRSARKADKTPRLVLLVATICWPVVAFAWGAIRYRQSRPWGEFDALAALRSGVSAATGLYMIVALICLAWWFYARD